MAQYDGSIRINTEINVKNAKVQLSALENRIVKTADKIASLRSKMDSLKNIKIPTQEYKNLEKEAAALEKQLLSLYDRQEKFLETGGKRSSSTYKRMEYDAETLEKKLQQVEATMERLSSEGKAFTLGKDTEQYAKLGQQLKYAENEIEILNQKHEVQSLKVQKAEEEYKKLGSAAENSLKRIASVIKKSAITSMQALGSITKKVGSSIKGVIANLLNIGKSSKSASVGLSSMNMGFKNILKYGLGIRSVYVLVNKLRTAAKEGFQNLAQYSKPVNASLSSLKSALTQLKNSLATAFAPILNAIAPALTTLINLASRAATAVGMLIAALTGQKSFVKATAVQEDYAASLKKTSSEAKKANKQLSGLDKLNNLTTQDKDSGDGGISPSDMFETVEIPSKIGDLAKMIKEAWEKADFTQIGKLIGKKLKEALNNIPWNKVKKTAKKVGKSLATLINGFVKTSGLGKLIGKTIAQAMNTGLKLFKSFAKNLDWKSVGKFIADMINGALKNIDWKTALSAASLFGGGLATALNNALTLEVFENIGTTIGNGLNTALGFAYSFLETFDWLQFGEGLAGLINTALDTLDTEKLGETLGAGLRAVIQAAFGFVTNLDFNELGQKIGDGINGFFEEMGKVDKKTGLTGWQELGKTLSTSITGILDTINTALSTVKWEEVGKAIADFISSIDWKGIVWRLGKLVSSLFNALVSAISSFTKTNPIAAAIVGLFAALKLTGLSGSLSKVVSKALKGKKLSLGKMVIGISLLAATFKLAGSKSKLAKLVAAPITAFIAAQTITGSPKVSLTIGAITLGATGGFELGSKIYEKIFDKPYPVKFNDIFTYNLEDWKTGFSMWFEEINTWLGNTFKNDFPFDPVEIAVKVAAKFTTTKKNTESWWSKITRWWGNRNVSTNSKFSTTKKNTESWWSKITRWWGKRYLSVGVKVGKTGAIAGAAGGSIPSISPPIKSKSVEIPKLATGAVIPANKEFLAVLGDQKSGRNLEAPEGLIRKIIKEETAGLDSGSGEITINLTVECEGFKLLQLMQKLDQEQYNRTGKPSFQM